MGAGCTFSGSLTLPQNDEEQCSSGDNHHSSHRNSNSWK